MIGHSICNKIYSELGCCRLGSKSSELMSSLTPNSSEFLTKILGNLLVLHLIVLSSIFIKKCPATFTTRTEKRPLARHEMVLKVISCQVH